MSRKERRNSCRDRLTKFNKTINLNSRDSNSSLRPKTPKLNRNFNLNNLNSRKFKVILDKGMSKE